MKSVRYAKMPEVPIRERSWPSASIVKSPRWCAVDLRDGNQALPNPMTPAQKMRYFRLLLDIGFKEIEIGFPSASLDDFQFCRDLIEQKLIPADVTISVLTQAREHLIARTMEALQGVERAVVHFYIATSELHSRFVFGFDEEGLIAAAVQSTRQIRDASKGMIGSQIGLEFSPEEFTDSPLERTVRICDAVIAAWQPGDNEKVILNLPQTVERRLPNQYADLIEEFRRRLQSLPQAVISVHNHNDMGCAVASTMQGLLAGAERVEGTLFGHGERTGNVDLATVAMNLEYMGIPTGLNFEKIEDIAATVEEITSIALHPRHPYAGELVFTAFSGSHQDAIHKGLSKKQQLIAHFDGWKIPYLHIDPSQVGRDYERFIRINSQSGKGGIAHIMERDYHVKLPRWAQIDLARHVQAYADKVQKEISGEEVWSIFKEQYMNRDQPIKLLNYWPRPAEDDPEMVEGELHVEYHGEKMVLRSDGNGPISAFVHAVRQIASLPSFVLDDYAEETMGHSAEAEAICFVRVLSADASCSRIGVGIGNNIDQAAARSVLSGLNALLRSSVGAAER